MSVTMPVNMGLQVSTHTEVRNAAAAPHAGPTA